MNFTGISRQRTLEIGVPLLAFSFTLAGILLWQAGTRFAFQYAAAGGFLASVLLAYLAWNLPRKDIVALSTPLYGLIFLVTPIDYAPGVILQLIYAAGLTVLVVRLHYRFGSSGLCTGGTRELAGPLRQYVDRVAADVPVLQPHQARSAGAVVIRYSTGDYAEASRRADRARNELAGAEGAEVLQLALGIVREHALNTEQGLNLPSAFLNFPPGQEHLLAHQVPADPDQETMYMTTLYNALLLLYAAAWQGTPADRDQLLLCREFAEKIFSR